MSDDDPTTIRPKVSCASISTAAARATFNGHVGNLYCKRGAKGTRDEFVLGFRVQQHMCNPAGGLHGGMMMTVADLVGTMGGGTAGRPAQVPADREHDLRFRGAGAARRLGRGPARAGARQTRSLLFTNIYLTVGEEKILRASAICKIPSGDGQTFGRAPLDRSAEVAAKGPATELVSRTVRPRRSRSAQPFLKKVSAIAAPSAPEMCGRRSDQSRHWRAK